MILTLKSGHQLNALHLTQLRIVVTVARDYILQYATVEGKRECEHALGTWSYCYGQNRKDFHCASTKLDQQQVSVPPSYRNSRAKVIARMDTPKYGERLRDT